ncbi:hypothetical protein [Halopiger xanaduensis]|uniref:Glutamate--cysteine ligase GCS2 n=1 Tax=Halopiger xanaduensis (strain DSM 18323 / JCM 14033 / SH-6) TaxID=797210 RepID=F8D3H4_HALXS|nr:hypothetical protein [Halopiger xanaduensis]AEH36200.1 glutamate--cysteine ligase GCS2 [Halopiger xanaduensis SH-6]
MQPTSKTAALTTETDTDTETPMMNTRLEADYWVVDSDGYFAPAGPLAGVDGCTVEKREPASLVTVTTPLSESIPALRQSFVDRLEEACARAANTERRLVPLATPINGTPRVDQPDDDRTRLRQVIADTEDDESDDAVSSKSGLDRESGPSVDRRYCAGARVCVERHAVTDQLNALLALTPALALVNSSPYVGGERVAAGARTHCHRTRVDGARDGRPCRYVDSAAEWNRRFEASADVGWTPVALRERADPPMIEWRAPDAALPKQLLGLAGDVATVMDRLRRGTVHIGGRGERADRGGGRGRRGTERTDAAPPGRVTSDGLALPRATTVADLVDAATYEGLESTPLAVYLERMGFAVDDYHPISARIDGRRYVSRADARELRLEYAGLLEADVAELACTLE